MPKANAISSEITHEICWETHLSTFFIGKFKLHELCGVTVQSSYTPDHGLILTVLSGDPTPVYMPNPTGFYGSGASGFRASGAKLNSSNFNEALFGSYHTTSVRSNGIRLIIQNGKLSSLPASKVDGQPVCPDWHTKACWNTNCNRVSDHIRYTEQVYQPLATWCQAHYPYTSSWKGGRCKNKLRSIKFLNDTTSISTSNPPLKE